MKTKLISLILLCAGVVLADPPKSITLDFDTLVPAPSLQLYRNDQKTLSVTLKNKSASVSTNGYTPLFYLYTGTNIQNISCSWISSNCIMQVNLTPTNLAVAGFYKYASGVSNTIGVTVAQSGQLKIRANPNH